MKIKYKLGNNTIKISIKGTVENWDGADDTVEARLSRSDFNFFFKMFGKVSPGIIEFYKGLNKTFTKHVKASKPLNADLLNNPDIIPANGHDIYNYVARYGMANYQIQGIFKLEGKLDFEKLARATRLSVDAQPVFGCRFIENEPPYWRRLDNVEKIEFCTLEETDEPEQAISRFLESPLDMDNDPLVKVKLIRSAEFDTLGVKVNHSCCDGAGLKEYIRLLSEIYTCIEGENGVYEPKPVTRSRKDQDRLFAELGIEDPNKFFIPGSDISIPTWYFPWERGGSSRIRFVIRQLSKEQLEAISRYTKAKGAKINDIILTAYYRAMLVMGEATYNAPMEIPITVDLRRYLPDKKTGAIRNFSGSVNTWLSMLKNEPFGDTLSRVVTLMGDIKNTYPGLQSAIGLERIEKISFRETLAYYQVNSQKTSIIPQNHIYYGDKCVPSLSNLGFVTRDMIKFGNNTVTEAYIVPPVIRAPGILLMVSTYNDIMTLAAGYYDGTILHQNVQKLLDKIKEEMVEGCSV